MKKINFFVVSKYDVPTVLKDGNITPLNERHPKKIISEMNDYIKDINISVDDIISINEKENYYNIFYKYEEEPELEECPLDDQTK